MTDLFDEINSLGASRLEKGNVGGLAPSPQQPFPDGRPYKERVLSGGAATQAEKEEQAALIRRDKIREEKKRLGKVTGPTGPGEWWDSDSNNQSSI